jgi:ribose transport system substrate-binding protein
MRQQRWVVFGAALCLALSATGCAKRTSEEADDVPPPGGATTTATGGGKTIRFAIVPKMLNNPVFALARRGAEKAARDLEAKTGNQYEIIYQSSNTGVASEQAETITRLAGSRVDGMSISVIDANAVAGPINEAVEAGIPVMCFDSDAPNTQRATFYAVDDIAIGQELARQFLAGCGGPKEAQGEVAILSGQSSAPNLQNRVKGVTDYLKQQAPNIRMLPTLYCDDKIDVAVEQIQTTLRAKPNLRGILMVGGWPLFADNALESVKDPKRTVVVSVDALPNQREYLKNGQVYCLIGQKCFGWGEESVRVLEDLRTGAKKGYGDFIDSGYDLVFNNPTPEQRQMAKGNIKVYSAAEYDKQWEEWNQDTTGR